MRPVVAGLLLTLRLYRCSELSRFFMNHCVGFFCPDAFLTGDRGRRYGRRAARGLSSGPSGPAPLGPWLAARKRKPGESRVGLVRSTTLLPLPGDRRRVQSPRRLHTCHADLRRLARRARLAGLGRRLALSLDDRGAGGAWLGPRPRPGPGPAGPLRPAAGGEPPGP